MIDIVDLVWHDGILAGVTVSGNGEVAVQCALYLAESAKDRVALTLSCSGVGSMTCAIDFLSLRDHARAGNITNGYVEHRARQAILKLFLSDGYVEIRARTIRYAVDGPAQLP